MIGAFAFRMLATLLAIHLLSWPGSSWSARSTCCTWRSTTSSGQRRRRERRQSSRRSRGSGLSAFWATVVKVELTDIVFAVDSILVAVAMSTKTWVIISGGLLGIVAMRLVIGQLLSIVRRYPSLVDAAFIIIAWIGLKLLVEYLHVIGLLHFEINKWFSFGLIGVIFGVAYLYARRQGPVERYRARRGEGALQGVSCSESSRPSVVV